MSHLRHKRTGHGGAEQGQILRAEGHNRAGRFETRYIAVVGMVVVAHEDARCVRGEETVALRQLPRQQVADAIAVRVARIGLPPERLRGVSGRNRERRQRREKQ